MGMQAANYRFGPYELRSRPQELYKDGVRMKLRPQPIQVLNALVERAGEVLTRDEMRELLWPKETFVDFEHGLNAAISELRGVLNDTASNPRYIETLPKIGYRIKVPIERIKSDPTKEPTEPDRIIGNRLAGGQDIGRNPLRDSILSEETSGVINAASVSAPAPALSMPSSRLWAVAGFVCLALVLFAIAYRRHSRQHAAIHLQAIERQLTTNSSEAPVVTGRLSPDGRYLAYSDVQGVHLKFLETGEIRTLALPESQKRVPLEWYVNAWFPDGTRFLVNSSSPGALGDIWAFSIMGSQPRALRQHAWGWSVSPDGASIAFATKTSLGYGDIWVMNANGEEVHQIDNADPNTEFDTVRWSPDGQWLAYVRIGHASKKQQVDIEVRELHGGTPRVLLPMDTEFFFPDLEWLSDGQLIFTQQTREQGEDCDLWTMRLDLRTAQPVAPAERLTNWPGFCPQGLSASADGKRLAFEKTAWQESVYVGEVGPNAILLGPPTRLTLNESTDEPSDWTPDGRAVLFTSDRNGHQQIFKQPLGSDTPELIEVGFPNPSVCCVSPDGSWILFNTTRDWEAQTWELRRIPLQGGITEFVATVHYGADAGIRCSKSPAALCAVAEYTEDHRHLIFTALDPLNGRGRELVRYDTDPSGRYSWDLSRDGSRIALLNPPDGVVHILHLNGEPSEQIVVRDLNVGDALGWWKDNSALLIDNVTARGAALSYLSMNGKAHPIWEVPGSRNARFNQAPWGILSPDGKQLAINGFILSSNVWMVENF
jgi:Tol biopolymer transport system component/DNA-binding winged helix-turn-helix (wHTH) protein